MGGLLISQQTIGIEAPNAPMGKSGCVKLRSVGV
jgi:hypothetical protein